MLLVVIGHIDLNNNPVDLAHPVANIIHSTIYGFHMPLFMFISGYLFYMTRIFRGKSFKETMTDKLKRLYIPMLFFTLATFIPKVVLAPLMKHPAEVSLKYLIDVFILYKINPLAEMWFIISLIVLMLLYPLYRYTNRNIFMEFALLIITLILCIGNINCDYFQLGHVTYMLFFFYGGILACKYKVQRYLNNVYSLILSAVILILINILLSNLTILINIIGIIFSFALCENISKKSPNLFYSYRNYTYQILLMGIFFQMAVRYIYGKDQTLIPYWILYVLSILIGIYMPVIISKAIKKINNKYINLCFGL